MRPFLQEYLMRRLLHYLINNIREHLMLYLFLWGLLAIMDLIYVFYFYFNNFELIMKESS